MVFDTGSAYLSCVQTEFSINLSPLTFVLVVPLMLMSIVMYGQIPDSTWHTFRLGSPALMITLPAEPVPLEVRIDPRMLESIHAFYAYSYEDYTMGYGVMMTATDYSDKKQPQLRDLAVQSEEDLKDRGARNIKYDSHPYELEGRKGIQQNGTLDIEGWAADFTTIILQHDADVWKVVLYSKAGDESAKAMTRVILDSMTFEK